MIIQIQRNLEVPIVATASHPSSLLINSSHMYRRYDYGQKHDSNAGFTDASLRVELKSFVTFDLMVTFLTSTNVLRKNISFAIPVRSLQSLRSALISSY